MCDVYVVDEWVIIIPAKPGMGPRPLWLLGRLAVRPTLCAWKSTRMDVVSFAASARCSARFRSRSPSYGRGPDVETVAGGAAARDDDDADDDAAAELAGAGAE